MKNSVVEPEETDEEYDYEFDAAHFFDFTKPEIDSEIEEAERWFEVSGDYPPSAYTVKLNLEKLLSGKIVVIPSKTKCSKKTKSTSSTSDMDSQNAKEKSHLVPQDTPKAEANSADKLFEPRKSTLMEPTASHLAKQHTVHDEHSGHICTSHAYNQKAGDYGGYGIPFSWFQKVSAKLDQRSLQSPTGLDNPETKRQKLEMGYSSKVAHLKHKYSLSHKSSKQVTVPREPELETMLRAQRRGSKFSSASSETERQKQEFNFKAHPLNRKILQAPSLLQRKRSIPQSPDFQVFHLKTSERAHAKDLASSSKHLESPPTEQFTKLSLGSHTKTSSASELNRHASAKSLKKDGRESFQAESWKCHAKPNQCGGHTRVHEVKCWSNMSRSLDIH